MTTRAPTGLINAFYNIALPYWKAEGLRKDDSMNGGQRRNTLVIEALTRWVANSHGYNHAHSSRFEMSTRNYSPRMAFLPQNTVLGQTVTISIFQSTLWSHPSMHRRKHRAAAATLHWHRRRNELASKIMLDMINCDNLINGFIVKVLSVTITSLPSPTTAGENLAPLCQVLNQTWAYKCFLGFVRPIFTATFWKCSSNTLTIFWQ